MKRTFKRILPLFVFSFSVCFCRGAEASVFLTFTFPESAMAPYQPAIHVETGEISNANRVPSTVDITALKPVFTTTATTDVVRVNGIVQKSGATAQDFTKPVAYCVTKADGTQKEFIVALKRSVVNPVFVGSYADPTVIRVGREFYLYVTGSRVRGYRSTDLLRWEHIGYIRSEVFDEKPNFTGDTDPGMWAPDINYFDGRYVMYYSMSVWDGGATCGIGVAVSDKPHGPFLPPAGNPNGKLFVSGEIGVHNSIDPCFFEENGRRYLFWGSFHGLYMTELTADGMAVKDLNDKTKVGGKSFEATYIHKRGNYYYLFASIGSCCEGFSSTYKVVVGRSTKLEGPYKDKTGKDMTKYDAWNPSGYNPIILKGNDLFGGPGHNSRIITDDNGVDWILYHSFVNNGNNNRQLILDKVEWDAAGWPVIGSGAPAATIDTAPVFR